jgi:serine/threonine protein kinase
VGKEVTAVAVGSRDSTANASDDSGSDGEGDSDVGKEGPERADWEKMFAGAVEIECLFKYGDHEAMDRFETVRTRIIRKRTRMANPLLKSRDAVVFQDAFYIVDTNNSDTRNPAPLPLGSGVASSTVASALKEGGDQSSVSSALKLLVNESVARMQSHLGTISAARLRHVSELNAAKLVLEAATAISSKDAGAGGVEMQSGLAAEDIQNTVSTLQNIVDTMDSEIEAYQSLVSDALDATLGSSRDAVTSLLNKMRTLPGMSGTGDASVALVAALNGRGGEGLPAVVAGLRGAPTSSSEISAALPGASTISSPGGGDAVDGLTGVAASGGVSLPAGTFVVYEISVQHDLCPPSSQFNGAGGKKNSSRRGSFGSSKHVRSEVLLSLYVVQPFSILAPFKTANDDMCSVLTSILQLDPVGLPQWMMRSVVDSPALHGRARYRVGVNYDQQRRTKLKRLKKLKKKKGQQTTSTQKLAGQTAGPPGGSMVPHPRLYDYNVLAVLGRGGYGKVLLVQEKAAVARNADVNVLFAMKVIRKAILTKEKQVKRTRLERDIMARATHPFVVNLQTAFQTPENLYMVMEFAQGGDLFTHLHRDGPFLEPRVRVYACEIILALEHLNSAGVIYRDLKPENILLDAAGHIKMVDFGLARAFSNVDDAEFGGELEAADAAAANDADGDGDGADGADGAGGGGGSGGSHPQHHGKSRFPSSKYQTKSFAGTERYMAPEQLLQKSYSFAVDWFQLGITLAELLTRRHPFQGSNHYQTMKNIVDATYIPVLRVSRRMPPLSGEVVSFLDSLLQRNPARRLGAVMPSTGKVNARDHPWFSTIDWDSAFRRELDAGFIPIIASNKDVSNFDDVFTRETAELSGEQMFGGVEVNAGGDEFALEEGERGRSVSSGGGGLKSRKNVTWTNLWGILGASPTDGGSQGDLSVVSGGSGGGAAAAAAAQRDGVAKITGSGVTYVEGGVAEATSDRNGDQNVFAGFDGFSFDAPSLAAMSIAEEGEETEDDGQHAKCVQ